MRGEGERVAGSQPMSTAVYTGAQINFGYLTPYLTYAYNDYSVQNLSSRTQRSCLIIGFHCIAYSYFFQKLRLVQHRYIKYKFQLINLEGKNAF
jgi:hypothetical protein